MITAAVTIVGLQIGYLLGIAIRRLRVLTRVGRLRPRRPFRVLCRRVAPPIRPVSNRCGAGTDLPLTARVFVELVN